MILLIIISILGYIVFGHIMSCLWYVYFIKLKELTATIKDVLINDTNDYWSWQFPGMKLLSYIIPPLSFLIYISVYFLKFIKINLIRIIDKEKLDNFLNKEIIK